MSYKSLSTKASTEVSSTACFSFSFRSEASINLPQLNRSQCSNASTSFINECTIIQLNARIVMWTVLDAIFNCTCSLQLEQFGKLYYWQVQLPLLYTHALNKQLTYGHSFTVNYRSWFNSCPSYSLLSAHTFKSINSHWIVSHWVASQ